MSLVLIDYQVMSFCTAAFLFCNIISLPAHLSHEDRLCSPQITSHVSQQTIVQASAGQTISKGMTRTVFTVFHWAVFNISFDLSLRYPKSPNE